MLKAFKLLIILVGLQGIAFAQEATSLATRADAFEVAHGSCGYNELPYRVKAADYAAKITKKGGGNDLCIARSICLGSQPTELLAKRRSTYSWVACLPKNGNCSQSYADCAKDSDFAFVDDWVADSKISERVGVGHDNLGAEGRARVFAWDSGFRDACDANIHRFCGPQASCGDEKQGTLDRESAQTLKFIYPTLEDLVNEAGSAYREGEIAGTDLAQELRKTYCPDSRVLGELILKPLPDSVIQKYSTASPEASGAR